MPSEVVLDEVSGKLGRVPLIPFKVGMRHPTTGSILVIENLPIGLHGDPNPNWFWLLDPPLVKAVDRLEASGGVREAERAIDAKTLELAHNIYRSGRSALARELGVKDANGGVGGARRGVKCLHAHLAFYLVGGFSPVGCWTASRLLGEV